VLKKDGGGTVRARLVYTSSEGEEMEGIVGQEHCVGLHLNAHVWYAKLSQMAYKPFG